MAVILKEIATFIEAQTVFILGVDKTLQYGKFNLEAPEDCVKISQSGGKPNFYLGDQVEFMLQVVSRAKNLVDADANAMILYNLFHTLADQDLSDKFIIMTSEAAQYPAPMGGDAQGREQYSVNFIVRIMNYAT